MNYKSLASRSLPQQVLGEVKKGAALKLSASIKKNNILNQSYIFDSD